MNLHSVHFSRTNASFEPSSIHHLGTCKSLLGACSAKDKPAASERHYDFSSSHCVRHRLHSGHRVDLCRIAAFRFPVYVDVHCQVWVVQEGRVCDAIVVVDGGWCSQRLAIHSPGHSRATKIKAANQHLYITRISQTKLDSYIKLLFNLFLSNYLNRSLLKDCYGAMNFAHMISGTIWIPRVGIKVCYHAWNKLDSVIKVDALQFQE